ncbi:MAG TPA: BatD family protein [Mizugakiibacter sp.]
MKRLLAALSLLCVLAVPYARAASVRAFLDRDTARLGETVTLNVESDGAGSNAPDFGALARDFDVRGRSSSRDVSIVNGHTTTRTLWAVALQPKRAGTLSIPALQVDGARTQPLTLTVLPAPTGAEGQAGDAVFIESSVEPLAPYVDQQVLYTLRLYYAPNLTDGDLDEPHADGVDVRRLGDDLHYTAERAGRMYHVVERRYALLPRKAGALTLPGIGFRGRALALDNGAFFADSQPVAARSQALQIDVRPPPADASRPWLPAQSLSLEAEGWPADGRLRAGEPLTLTLTLKATGLPFEALPALTLPTLDGAEVYPDKPQDNTRDDGHWLVGTRVLKFAIVPTHAGTLALPAITVQWWDAQHDLAALARIPARSLQVLPAVGAPAASPAAPAPKTAPSAPTDAAARPTPRLEKAAPVIPAAALRAGGVWRVVALISLALWLLSALAALGLWAWRRRGKVRRKGNPATGAMDRAALRRACLDAARTGDLRGAEAALLVWARRERPTLRGADALAGLLADPAQREAWAALLRARYAGASAEGVGTRFAGAFARGIVWPRDDRAKRVRDDAVLPPLYPGEQA